MGAACRDPLQKIGLVGLRDGPVAGDPCKEIGILQFEEPLILVEFVGGQALDLLVRKPAQDKIHLADAAMPGPKEQLALAHVQPLA